ncbi:MAG: DEAD/DEAH box helicase [Parachlamydiaceae bacterium]
MALQPLDYRLQSNIETWIKGLETAYREASCVKSAMVKKRQNREIRYVIQSSSFMNMNRFAIIGQSVKLLQNGSLSGGRPDPFNAISPGTSQSITDAMKEEDWVITKNLLQAGFNTSHYSGSIIYLESRAGFGVLKSIVETKRCYFETYATAHPLCWGEKISCCFEWVVDMANNCQQLMPSTGNSEHLIRRIGEQGVYIDPKENIIGELEFQESPKALALLFNSPTIPLSAVDQVKDSIVRSALPEKFVPKEIKKEEIKVDPKPVMRVYEIDEADLDFDEKDPYFNGYFYDDDDDDDYDDDLEYKCLGAEILFDYAGHLVQYSNQQKEKIETRRTQNALVTIHRNLQFEQDAVKLIWRLNWEHDEGNLFIKDVSEDGVDVAFLNFLKAEKPILAKAGWQIEVSNDFPVHRVFDSDDIYIDANPANVNNWFDVELGVLIDGQRVNLLPFLKKVLKDAANFPDYLNQLSKIPGDQKIPLMNNQKEMVLLPAERVLHFLTLFNADSLSKDDNKITMSSWNAILLGEMGAAGNAALLRWFGDNSLKDILQTLRDPVQSSQITFPAEFHCELRPYQIEGVAWMQTLRKSRLSGILADDMGLGKTVQTIAHLTLEKEQGRLTFPSLVVVPTTLLSNWVHELKRFAPHFKVLVLHGNERKQHFGSFKDYDLIFTTYPLLSRDKEPLMSQEFYYLIMDEAQNVKNSKTLAYQIVHQIRASHRLLLTGTPMENHLGEIWSLFHLLMPGLLGDEKTFNRVFRKPIEKEGDKKRQALLAKRLNPFMMRRTKDLVAKELPEKTVIIQRIELDVKQRDLYESIRLKAQEKVMKEIASKGFNRSQIMVLDALMKMRQACCDPRLVKLTDVQNIPSAKLNYLKEVLPQMIEEGKRVILFSQFTSMLALIEVELKELKIDYEILTGDTSDRETPIKRFQKGEIPLILLSLKAGGVGINLTAADTVIFFDPWWNPAAENQATDRAHRIGQNKAVFVYKLVTEGTVEEKILALQERKQRLLDAVFNTDEGDMTKLSPEDLEDLFQPLR